MNGVLTLDDESEDEIEAATFDANVPLTPPHLNERRKISRDLLKMKVHHGDIIIQQGAGLQKYYEVLSFGTRVYSSTQQHRSECESLRLPVISMRNPSS